MTDSERFRIVHAVMKHERRADADDVRETWDRFLAETDNLIRRCVARFLRRRQDREDAVQDVWRIVVAAIRGATYDVRRECFDAWMVTVVTNGVSRSIRTRRERLRFVDLKPDQWKDLIDDGSQPLVLIGADRRLEDFAPRVARRSAL